MSILALCCVHPCGVCVSVHELRDLGYKKGKPVGLVGVTELSDDQKKQLKEQQEVLHDRQTEHNTQWQQIVLSLF